MRNTEKSGFFELPNTICTDIELIRNRYCSKHPFLGYFVFRDFLRRQ